MLGNLCLLVVLVLIVIYIHDRVVMKSGTFVGGWGDAGTWNGNNQDFYYGSYSSFGTKNFDGNLGGPNPYTLTGYSH